MRGENVRTTKGVGWRGLIRRIVNFLVPTETYLESLTKEQVSEGAYTPRERRKEDEREREKERQDYVEGGGAGLHSSIRELQGRQGRRVGKSSNG